MNAATDNMVGGANKPSLVMKFAQKYNIVEATLLNTLKQTAFKSDQEVSNEQMVALLVVADQYNLNPFTKEIYAYPDKYKGIVPVVSIDGWVRIVTEHEDYNGYEVILPDAMIEAKKEGEHPPCWAWITIKMHRKRVEFTPPLTEYFDECYKPPYKPRGKDYFIDSPWQTHPKRFLRHKAFIQAGRMVFGFAGIYDDDEAQRIIESGGRADPTLVGEQGTRTVQATEKLRQQLTNQAGTGGLDLPLKNMERVVAQQKQADVLNHERAAEAPEKTEPKKKPPPFKYGLAEALALLRSKETVEDLKKAYQEVEDDYEFSGREIPIDIEAIYRDLLEDRQGRTP